MALAPEWHDRMVRWNQVVGGRGTGQAEHCERVADFQDVSLIPGHPVHDERDGAGGRILERQLLGRV